MSEATPETRKFPIQYRAAIIIRAGDADDDSDRTVDLAFSSEEPADQFFGVEVLDHTKKAVRMDRFKSGRSPLLMDHNSRDQVGVIEKASIDSDRIGRATVRFGKGTRADEILQDVRDGIRANISVGYTIHEVVIEQVKDDDETWRVTDWEPKEISVVSIPADNSVGVGRNDEEITNCLITRGETLMNEPTPNPNPNPNPAPPLPPVVAGPTPAELETIRAEAGADAVKLDNIRRTEIMALAKRHNKADLGEEHCNKGTSIELFRGMLLDVIGENKPLDAGPGDLGLSTKQVRDYSLMRAIRANLDKRFDKDAPFEHECALEIAKRAETTPRGFLVPTDIQRDGTRRNDMKRDLTAGTATSGLELVGTDHMGSSFIDLLRNAMMVRKLGARMLTGLRGNIAIPKLTGAGTATWIATEGGAVTESTQATASVAMAPKNLGTFTDMTRQLIAQSDPSVEQLVRDDLALVLALAIDLAAINGSGASGEPEGILQATGIGDVPGGTNGLVPTWQNIVDIWKEVAIDNAAFGSVGWLINAATVAKLSTVEKAATTAQFIVSNFPDAQGMTNLAGMRAAVSNQVPSNLTKGSGTNLSAILFGNWADVMIGEWGILDILVNPYTLTGTGSVRIEVYQTVDVAIRHVESFAAMQDAITV